MPDATIAVTMSRARAPSSSCGGSSWRIRRKPWLSQSGQPAAASQNTNPKTDQATVAGRIASPPAEDARRYAPAAAAAVRSHTDTAWAVAKECDGRQGSILGARVTGLGRLTTPHKLRPEARRRKATGRRAVACWRPRTDGRGRQLHAVVRWQGQVADESARPYFALTQRVQVRPSLAQTSKRLGLGWVTLAKQNSTESPAHR